jgi:UPF0716 protein FxsA
MWLLLLILWPIAELFVAFKVAEAIGFLWTLLLIVASWPIGSWAMRSQGRLVMRHLREAMAAGEAPARSMLEGALVVVGGLLLIVPGFITDVVGVLLLLPPSRALAERIAERRLQRGRFSGRGGPGGRGGSGGRRGRPDARQEYDVEGTAVDVNGDWPQLSR